MRIQVPITQTRYGYIEFDADDSLFTQNGTTSRDRHIAVKALAETVAHTQGEDAITWTDDAPDIKVLHGYQEVTDISKKG